MRVWLSILSTLNPLLDDYDIYYRVGGRLENAHLTYNQRHPIVLPAKELLTRLYINNTYLERFMVKIGHFATKVLDFEGQCHNFINYKWLHQMSSIQGVTWTADAGAQSVKYKLKSTIGEVKSSYEEFSTILTQIEACLNSRPICPITQDPDDLEILTAGHFLIGQAVLAVPERSLLNKNETGILHGKTCKLSETKIINLYI